MNLPTTEFVPRPDALTDEELELSKLIVSTLDLEVDPGGVDPAAPLYGSGLGLDSIDILEITLSISRVYGVKLRSDEEHGRSAFASLRSLSQYIQQHRAK